MWNDTVNKWAILRGIHFKTTVSYHLSLVRITIIKNQKITSAKENMEKKRILSHHWQECKIVQPQQITVLESFSQKIKSRTAMIQQSHYWNLSDGNKPVCQREICTSAYCSKRNRNKLSAHQLMNGYKKHGTCMWHINLYMVHRHHEIW